MKSVETCSNLCNKLYTYLYHHIVVLDKYIHSNLVYYKHNGDGEPYDCPVHFKCPGLYCTMFFVMKLLHPTLKNQFVSHELFACLIRGNAYFGVVYV